MAGDFEGKVAVVTGAGSGIGRASARGFAARGAHVVVADIDATGGQATVSLIEDGDGSRSATFVQCDISDPAQVEAMVAKAVDSWGRLDFAHNNAGAEGTGVATHLYPVDQWRRIIEVNLIGTWLCMKQEIEQMLKQGGGAIVNTASIAGLVASPVSGSAYTASKHGVIGLTKSAALEYARLGIRVNCVCPGPIDTPMVQRHIARTPGMEQRLLAADPMGRLGAPAEIAAAVAWLCSDAASFVTGHPMVVDGGFIAQ